MSTIQGRGLIAVAPIAAGEFVAIKGGHIVTTGFASLLMLLTAADAGLGARFSGIPAGRAGACRAAFGVPARFTPIGAICIGYSHEPPPDLSSRRRPEAETVHRGRRTQPGS